ncbi:hypothetical protein C8034_v007312 [Colletotrichum sidae]|uniref:Uncharacterized protein n=1 Tax=Colletotrichum sidae TaxID=1347389 RepID=A0A4R8T3Q8_9PEZI|nr:hypothetical protein C8034_v007312 [Colletotrichum sidae]
MLQFACRRHGEQHETDPGMDIVDGLLRDGADINASNGEGEPALIVAVKARNKVMTARLLKQAAHLVLTESTIINQRLQHPEDKTVISAALKSVSAGDTAMKMVMAQLEVLSPEHEDIGLHLWRDLGGIAVLPDGLRRHERESIRRQLRNQTRQYGKLGRSLAPRSRPSWTDSMT